MGFIREIDIDAPLDRVWHAFTSATELQHWLCERAHVEFEPGGAYECFWGPEGTQSTEGCRIIAIETSRRLSFQFRGTGQYADLSSPDQPAVIDVQFHSRGAAGSTVIIEQTETRTVPGWASYDEWAAEAWESALLGLKEHCEEGTTSVSSREAFLD